MTFTAVNPHRQMSCSCHNTVMQNQTSVNKIDPLEAVKTFKGR